MRPTSGSEAVRLAQETRGLYLAGGTELNWRGAPEADTLICLADLPWRFIRREAGTVAIGPTTTLQDLADSAELPAAGLGVLVRAARSVGNRSIRELATVGGNIAANKSCSDLIPSLLVLGAALCLASPEGEQELPLGDYVAAPDRRALITAVRVAEPSVAWRIALERYARAANDLALVNVALAVRLDGTTLCEARLALGGVAATVVRLPAVEAALAGADVAGELAALAATLATAVAAAIHPIDDLRGSAAFKATVAAELSQRALARALAPERS